MIINKCENGIVKNIECSNFKDYLNIIEPDWEGNMDDPEQSVFRDLFNFIEEYEHNNNRIIEKHSVSDSHIASSIISLQHLKEILFEGVTASVKTHKANNDLQSASYQFSKKFNG